MAATAVRPRARARYFKPYSAPKTTALSVHRAQSRINIDYYRLLKEVFQSKLNDARVYGGSGDFPERARVIDSKTDRIGKLSVIESVKELRSEDHLLALGDVCGLDDGNIEIKLTRAENDARPRV